MKILELVKQRYSFELNSCCLMTNHVHLLLKTEKDEIWKIMKMLLSRYAMEYNHKYDYTGHVFERRYHAILIEDPVYLLEVSRYIHLNPVKARMVTDPLNYDYSSYTSDKKEKVMLISERIFEQMKIRGMTQKEFARATGIAESTISDWKRRKTNPVSEKILIICQVLQISPYELLSGTDGQGTKSRLSEFIVVDKNTELGEFLLCYQRLDRNMQERMLGYMRALCDNMNGYGPNSASGSDTDRRQD